MSEKEVGPRLPGQGNSKDNFPISGVPYLWTAHFSSFSGIFPREIRSWTQRFPSGNQTWLAGKWTIDMKHFPKIEPPFSSGICQPAILDYQRVPVICSFSHQKLPEDSINTSGYRRSCSRKRVLKMGPDASPRSVTSPVCTRMERPPVHSPREQPLW